VGYQRARSAFFRRPREALTCTPPIMILCPRGESDTKMLHTRAMQVSIYVTVPDRECRGAGPSILSAGAAACRRGGGLPHDEGGGKHQGGVLDGAPFEYGVQECPGASPELVAG
jgi:hypothetical protein